MVFAQLSPALGAIITLGYIMAYVGVSAAFIIVFREIENLKKDLKLD